jgi:nucleoside-diphosphate-sugar epimerase
MKVFVAGASGAIGRPAVRQLVAAGHEVTGMTRREERAAEIRQAGANAVVCDAFDATGLEAAVREATPEAVVHLLTAIPARMNFRAKESPLAATNRLRSEGTRNLLAAAKAAGARRLVAESVAFLYAPTGGAIKDEDAPLFADAPRPFDDTVAALEDLERQATGSEQIEGLVLRFGQLYGPGTYFGEGGSQSEEVLKRRLPIVGEGGAVFSFIHVEDAASATLAAVERGAPGTYNVVDDEPAPMSEWVPAFAKALGAKPPRRVPVWLARLVAGAGAAVFATETRGASNEKAKRELGWQPSHPSWREGFADPAVRG